MNIIAVDCNNWQDGIQLLEFTDASVIQSKFFNPSSITQWMTEHQLVDELDSIIHEFPEREYSDAITIREYNEHRTVQVNRRWKNCFYYRGEWLYDSPIIVIKYSDHYSPMIHPHALTYGFLVK